MYCIVLYCTILLSMPVHIETLQDCKRNKPCRLLWITLKHRPKSNQGEGLHAEEMP